MKRSDLELQFACDADVYAMEREGTTCHCASCDHAVYDLSAMTEREARAFLKRHEDERICIQYVHDESGHVFFAEEQAVRWRLFRQIEGLRRMAAAAMIAAPLLVAACDAPDHNQIGQPEAQTPLVIQEGQPVKLDVSEPGAAKPPTFKPAEQAQAAAEQEHIADTAEEAPCDKPEAEAGDAIHDVAEAPEREPTRMRGKRAMPEPNHYIGRTAGKPMNITIDVDEPKREIKKLE